MMDEDDAYAMPSRWEGFSAAAVEALATGTASVFSNIDPFIGPLEAVALFHPVDDAGALAERLIELADYPDRRADLGRRSRPLVEDRYSMPAITNRYRDLYVDVLGQ